ncbi:amino acid permease 8-like isoform X2 [Macadamia integrifolia]|uniref:amino acid permease 8-like isoform X2 n=1 Tax=Macadamia integrifolia TaxID=60698 RepID=UPI001C4F20DC|nr:amino acid permease 8-like isoform X2 [Macadamia integrifolia]
MDMKDGDGRQRTGTVWTATTHAITAVVGSGVLALPWSVAQMGWIFGPLALIIFAVITYYTALLLCDCYRSPDPVTGRRNYTYVGVVRACLGKKELVICGIIQYIMLWGTIVGYVITAATSMMAVKRSNCLHYKGHDARCGTSGTLYMLIFGGIEIILSQFPNLEKVTLLSVMAAIMSFTYLFISLYLCIQNFASHHKFKGTLTGVKAGVNGISQSTKVWRSFQALGNIAFAYTFAMLLVEIQDTLKSPPAENKTMKKASLYGLAVTTSLYVSLGCVGYLAFGNNAPGNVLTGFYEPFWLVDIANLAVLIHLIGAFQVYAQPIFSSYEKWLASKCPSTVFFNKVYTVRLPFTEACFRFTICKLVLRTLFCIFTTLVAMMLPFFNAILGLLGSIAFWPLTVYFPVTMYISQAKIKTGSFKWLGLQSLSLISLLVSLVSALGSVADIIDRLKHAKIFSVTF